jgi:hypothetical protein
MDAIKKRKKLLESFSKNGTNECCCWTTTADFFCCDGFFYFSSSKGKIGVLCPDEQEINTIWDGYFSGVSCYKVHVGIFDTRGLSVFYRGNQINEKFYKSVKSFSASSSYIVLEEKDTLDLDIYYLNKKVLGSLPNLISSRLLILDDYFFVGRTDDNSVYDLYYKEKLILEGITSTERGQTGDNFYFKENLVTRLFFKGEIVAEHNNGEKILLLGNYTVIGTDLGFVTIYWRGEKIGTESHFRMAFFKLSENYLLTFNEQTSTLSLYYQGTYIAGKINFSSSMFNSIIVGKHYVFGGVDYSFYNGVAMNVGYNGTSLFESEYGAITYTPTSEYPTSCFLYYNGELVDSRSQTFVSMLNNYTLVLNEYTSPTTFTLYYKNKNIIDEQRNVVRPSTGCDELFAHNGQKYVFGELLDGTIDLQNWAYTICCNNIFALSYSNYIIHVWSNNASFGVVTPGAYLTLVPEVDLCCNNRLALFKKKDRYTNDYRVVSIFDLIFGRMDFDGETFLRLDG